MITQAWKKLEDTLSTGDVSTNTWILDNETSYELQLLALVFDIKVKN